MQIQNEYKIHYHNKVCFIQWTSSNKYEFDTTSQSIIDLWGFMIQCDHEIKNEKPEIVVLEEESKRCKIIDIAWSAGNKVYDKEESKVERCNRLA